MGEIRVSSALAAENFEGGFFPSGIESTDNLP